MPAVHFQMTLPHLQQLLEVNDGLTKCLLVLGPIIAPEIRRFLFKAPSGMGFWNRSVRWLKQH